MKFYSDGLINEHCKSRNMLQQLKYKTSTTIDGFY